VPFYLNTKTCDGKRNSLRAWPRTSKEEAHQLFDERMQAPKGRRAKIKEEKAEKCRKLERIKKAKMTQQHDVRKCKSAIRFMLEDVIIDAAAEDTGADATVVPDAVIAKMSRDTWRWNGSSCRNLWSLQLQELTAPFTCSKNIIVKRVICQVSSSGMLLYL
jgi:hypothetical protein